MRDCCQTVTILLRAPGKIDGKEPGDGKELGDGKEPG